MHFGLRARWRFKHFDFHFILHPPTLHVWIVGRPPCWSYVVLFRYARTLPCIPDLPRRPHTPIVCYCGTLGESSENTPRITIVLECFVGTGHACLCRSNKTERGTCPWHFGLRARRRFKHSDFHFVFHVCSWCLFLPFSPFLWRLQVRFGQVRCFLCAFAFTSRVD